MLDAEHRAGHRHEHPHWTVGRVAFLALSVICIYFFAPSIAEVFSAYDRLGEVQPIYLLPATACAIGSFASVWLVQALALGHARLVLGEHDPARRERVQPHHAGRWRHRHRAPGQHARRRRLRRRACGDRAHGAVGAEHHVDRRAPRLRAAVHRLRHAGAVRAAPGVLDRDPRVPPHGRHRHRVVRRRRAAARTRTRRDLGPGQAPPGAARRPAGRPVARGTRPHPARDRPALGARAGGVARRAGCSSTPCSC